jgi:hypothetical protein
MTLDLDDEFESYMRKVNPTVPEHSTQYRESRRVFHAGAFVVFTYITYHVASLSEDEGVVLLAELEKHLHAFRDRVEQDKD